MKTGTGERAVSDSDGPPASPSPSWQELARRTGALPLGLAQLGQTFGLYLTLMALTVGAARIGHDRVFGLAALFVTMALPSIFLGPLIAPLVEGWNKRTVMWVGQVGKALSLAGAALFPGIWALAIAGFLVMAFHTLYLPGYRSLLSDVAQGDDQVRLTSLIHTGVEAAQMIGVGLGGAVAVFAAVSGALWLGAVVFAGSALAVTLLPRTFTGLTAMPSPAVALAPRPSYIEQIRVGMRAVGAAPTAVQILLVMAGVSIASYILNPILVLVPARILHVSLWWYPVFEVSQGLFGLLLGGLMAARLPIPPRRLMGWGFFTLGLAFVALSLSRSGILDIVIYGVAGLAQMAEFPTAMALYRNQFQAPVRVRAASTYSLVVSVSQVIGAILAGVLVHRTGVAGAVAVAGGVILLAAGLGAALHLFQDAAPAREPASAAVPS